MIPGIDIYIVKCNHIGRQRLRCLEDLFIIVNEMKNSLINLIIIILLIIAFLEMTFILKNDIIVYKLK